MQTIADVLKNIPQLEHVSLEEYEKNQLEWKNSIHGNLKGYDCQECLNRGYSFTAENTARDCECMKIRKSLKRIEKSGLKPLMERYTFDSYQTGEAWQQTIKESAERFLKNPDACFFGIFGQTGAGKTHLCTAMASNYLYRRIPVYYMLWNSDVKRIKATVNDGDIHEQEMKRLQEIDVLYIDDLFKCKVGSEPSDADVRLTFEIINARYNTRLTTIISSEFTIDELNGIDAAIAGRIREMCGSYLWNIKRSNSRNYRWRKS